MPLTIRRGVQSLAKCTTDGIILGDGKGSMERALNHLKTHSGCEVEVYVSRLAAILFARKYAESLDDTAMKMLGKIGRKRQGGRMERW